MCLRQQPTCPLTLWCTHVACPDFNREIWLMFLSADNSSIRQRRAFAPAGIACTSATKLPDNPSTLPNHYSGLLKRIGTTDSYCQPAKTTQSLIACGLNERLGNRMRMPLVRSFSGRLPRCGIGREPMSARAGPFG